MNKNRRFLLAALLSGTVLAAAGAIAGPLAVFDPPVSGDAAAGAPVHSVDWDEEDDDGWRKDKRRHGDDDDDDEDEDDGDDDGRNGRSQPSPAPVGTVAPPSNGLILQGSTPKVQVN